MMKRLHLLCLMLFVLSANAQEAQVRARIDTLFMAMYNRDTSLLRSCFLPNAALYTSFEDAQGNDRTVQETLSGFITGIAQLGDVKFEEKLTGWHALLDGSIASVWTPYELIVEGNFSHCGINSFQLIRINEQWKISQITDTRRKKDCVHQPEVLRELDSLINAWHHAASLADEDAFFGFMAPDGIYIGTDETERWLRDELAAWSKKYFERETAWDFTPMERNIQLAPSGQMAWFDEILDTWMGRCRSTGILEKREGKWFLIHYQLSIAVPNEKLDGYRILIGKD